jgi:hypothetical protein
VRSWSLVVRARPTSPIRKSSQAARGLGISAKTAWRADPTYEHNSVRHYCGLFDNGGEPMTMKHFLNGAAIAAVVAFAAPTWAQNPSGGNSMGMPGPSTGGPGLTPYSGGTPPPASTSAMPPMHRHPHHVMHATARRKTPPSAGDTTSALNQQELARIQAGAPPPAPPAPAPVPAPGVNPSGGNSMGMPGPSTGGPGLTPYTH